MRIRLVARPGELSREKSCLLNWLDAKCFPHDNLHEKEDRYWWCVFDGASAVAFAGLRLIGQYAWFARAGVLPTARGNGLQKRLIYTRVKYARRLSVIGVKTYTAYDNIHSANNLIACGFRLTEPHLEGLSDFLNWEIPLG